MNRFSLNFEKDVLWDIFFLGELIPRGFRN